MPDASMPEGLGQVARPCPGIELITARKPSLALAQTPI